MPKTLDNHLVGVTADRPHPESYRPDLPLLFTASEDEDDGEFDDGYDAGHADAKRAAASRERALVAENTSLRQQLEAKKSA